MANKIQVDLEVRNKASEEVKKFGKDAEQTFNKAKTNAENMNRSMSSSSSKFTAALNEIKAATTSATSTFSRMGSTISRQFSTMTGNVRDYKKSIDIAADAMKKLQTTTSRMPAVTAGKGTTTGMPVVPTIPIGMTTTGVAAGAAFGSVMGSTYGTKGGGGFSPRTSRKDYQGIPTGKKADVDQVVVNKLYEEGTRAVNKYTIAIKEALRASKQLKDLQTRSTYSMAEYKDAAAGVQQWGNAKKRVIDYETKHATAMVNTNAAMEIMNSKMIQSWQTQNLVSTGLKKLGTSLINVWKNIGLYAAAAGYAIMRFLGSSAKAYEDSVKVQSTLQAVLQATGYTAGYTAEQLADMASEIQKVTGVSDELVMEAQAIIAIFQNIRGEQFKEVTKLAVDLSMVMGGDVKSAAEQLAKALQDPIEGLTALGKAGIKFTDAEKKFIEEMVRAEKFLEAQNFILQRVKGSVEGVAEAYGKTDVGKIKIAIQAWEDMKESVGELVTTLKVALLPVIEEVTNAFKGAAMYISHIFGITLSAKIENLGVKLSGINEEIAKFEKLKKGGVKFFPEAFGESTDVEEQLKTLYTLRERLNTERTSLLERQNALRDLENKKAQAGAVKPRELNLPEDKEGVSKAEEAAKHMEEILARKGKDARDADFAQSKKALEQKYAEYGKYYKDTAKLQEAFSLEMGILEEQYTDESINRLKEFADEQNKLREDIKQQRFDVELASLRFTGNFEKAEIDAANKKYDELEKLYGSWIDYNIARQEELANIRKKYAEEEKRDQISLLNAKSAMYQSVANLEPTEQKGWRPRKQAATLSEEARFQSELAAAQDIKNAEARNAAIEVAYATHTNNMTAMTKQFEENRIAEDEKWLTQFLYGVKQAEEALPSWGETMVRVGREINDVMANNLSNAFIDFISRTKSAKDAFIDYAVSTTKWLLEIIAKQTILNTLMSMNSGGNTMGGGAGGGGFFSFFGSMLGGLQGGGMAAPGRPYVVGEKGPEIFVPNQGGRVLSNAQSQAAMGGGETSVDVNIANIIDPAAMDAYISSARGRNAILNVIGSNNRTVRRMVR